MWGMRYRCRSRPTSRSPLWLAKARLSGMVFSFRCLQVRQAGLGPWTPRWEAEEEIPQNVRDPPPLL